jgi:hypothetical protein
MVFLPQPVRFIKPNYYYFCAGAAGTAGAVAGLPCTGAAGAGAAGAAAAGLLLPDMIDDDDGFPEMYARVRDVSMKITAAPVVILLRNVVPPPAPKTDWLPLLPNEAPISAPLPDCSSTTAIMKILTATCNIVIAMDIHKPLTGKIRKDYVP